MEVGTSRHKYNSKRVVKKYGRKDCGYHKEKLQKRPNYNALMETIFGKQEIISNLRRYY